MKLKAGAVLLLLAVVPAVAQVHDTVTLNSTPVLTAIFLPRWFRSLLARRGFREDSRQSVCREGRQHHLDPGVLFSSESVKKGGRP
jgi:hypothetical protein